MQTDLHVWMYCLNILHNKCAFCFKLPVLMHFMVGKMVLKPNPCPGWIRYVHVAYKLLRNSGSSILIYYKKLIMVVDTQNNKLKINLL